MNDSETGLQFQTMCGYWPAVITYPGATIGEGAVVWPDQS